MDRFEELTAKYLDEGLSHLEGQELANHLRAYPEALRQVRTFYAQDRLLVELHRSQDAPAVEAIMTTIRGQERAFIASVMQRVRAPEHSRAVTRAPDVRNGLQTWWGSRLFWLGCGAVIVIALTVYLFGPIVGQPVLLVSKSGSVTLERSRVDLPASDKFLLQPNDLVAVVGTNSAAISYAPENTRMDLKPGTTVKLLDWTWAKRLELRMGRLEAAVARQRPLRPMLVRTPNAEIRVLGTKFTLFVRTNATRLEVTEGKVQFTRFSDKTSITVGAGQYAVAGPGIELAAQPLAGSILAEYWTNIIGRNWVYLVTSTNYPNRPDGWSYLTNLSNLEMPSDWADNYGRRLCGYIHIPTTGTYTFWIAAKDHASLWLSPNEDPENKVQMATSLNASSRDWESAAQQQTPALPLVAGKKYYFEVLHKAGVGEDHLAVAWQVPGREREIIPTEFLSPLKLTTKERKR